MRRYVPPFSFGVVLAVLSAATVIGVGASIVLHRSILIPFVIGAAIAVGVGYIIVFGSPALEEAPVEEVPSPEGTAFPSSPVPPSVGPGTPESAMASSPPVEPEPDEPFYDPVEEADRLDSARSRGESAPSGPDDSK